MPEKKVKSNSITGTVEWFDPIKGIGYIKTDEGNLVAVTYRDLPIKDGDFELLRKNQRIRFDIYEGEMGIQAKNITSLN